MTGSLEQPGRIRIKSGIYYLLTFILLSAVTVLIITKNTQPANRLSTPQATVLEEDSVVYITLSAVGDLMCHSSQFNFARIEGDSFNFVPCFEYVEPHLQAPDLLIGNLETTLRGTEIPYSGYPFFNTPDDYVESLKKTGFDFLITANNHSNDTGEEGILRTISVLDKNGFGHTGSFTSEADRDSVRIISVKGIKIAIVAYTYSTNGLPLTEGKPWLVNMCDSALIKKDIQQGRTAGADLVVVFYHFGEEYERLPSAYQKQFVQHAADCGADLIIGSHPHVIQPTEFFKTNGGALDTGFIAYSLGNFISNQSDEYTDEGVVLNIRLSKIKNNSKVALEGVDFVPTWVYRGKGETKKLHVVLPAYFATDTAAVTPDWVTSAYKAEMKSALVNTSTILTKYNTKVKPADNKSF